MDELVSPGLSSWVQSSVAAGWAQGNCRKGGQCAPRLSGHANLGVSGDVGDVYMYLQWESKRRNEAGRAWHRRSHTPTGQILLALWYACWFQACGTKTPAKMPFCTPAVPAALKKTPLKMTFCTPWRRRRLTSVRTAVDRAGKVFPRVPHEVGLPPMSCLERRRRRCLQLRHEPASGQSLRRHASFGNEGCQRFREPALGLHRQPR